MLPAQPFQPQEPEAEHGHKQNPKAAVRRFPDLVDIKSFVLA